MFIVIIPGDFTSGISVRIYGLRMADQILSVLCSHQGYAFICYIMRTILNTEFYHIHFIYLTGEIKFDKTGLRRTAISIEISTAVLKVYEGILNSWDPHSGSVRINHLILDNITHLRASNPDISDHRDNTCGPF